MVPTRSLRLHPCSSSTAPPTRRPRRRAFLVHETPRAPCPPTPAPPRSRRSSQPDSDPLAPADQHVLRITSAIPPALPAAPGGVGSDKSEQHSDTLACSIARRRHPRPVACLPPAENSDDGLIYTYTLLRDASTSRPHRSSGRHLRRAPTWPIRSTRHRLQMCWVAGVSDARSDTAVQQTLASVPEVKALRRGPTKCASRREATRFSTDCSRSITTRCFHLNIRQPLPTSRPVCSDSSPERAHLCCGPWTSSRRALS